MTRQGHDKGDYMKKSFIARVFRERSVDTKNYRYIVEETGYDDRPQRIKRIRLEYLDTTAALELQSPKNPNGWEIVHTE
jgi:hypothetical protein